MMKSLFSVGVMAVLFAGQPASAADLTDDDFHSLQHQLRPNADELWSSIPWKISLLDAQSVAAADRKPIFIWAMDGHPLGCT